MPFWKSSKNKTQTPLSPSNVPAARFAPAPPAVTPNAAGPFLLQGDDFLTNGNYNDAATMYRTAISKDGTNPHAYVKLAQALMLVMPARLDDALQNVNTAISYEPTMGPAWKLKGDVQRAMGDFNAARDSYRNALGNPQGLDTFQVQLALSDVQKRLSEPAPLNSIPRSPSNTGTGYYSSASSQVQQSMASLSLSQPHQPTMITPVMQQPQQPPATQPTIVQTPPPVINTPVPPPTQPTIIQTPPPVINTQAPPQVSLSPTQAPVSPPPSTSPLLNTAVPVSPSSNLAVQTPTGQARSPSPSPAAQQAFTAEDVVNSFGYPTDPPPSYTTNTSWNVPPQVSSLGSSTQQNDQITNMTNSLARMKQGGLYLQPYTAVGQIDSALMLFHGKNYLESILIDLGPLPQVHAALKKYHVDKRSYPGHTFLDRDAETASSHEGFYPGTVSFVGYTEEYREFQVLRQLNLQLLLEAQTMPPVKTVQWIVTRIQTLQAQPLLEDNYNLAILLGVAPSTYTATLDRQRLIEDICMIYHRGQYDAPSRFIDLSREPDFSTHLFSTVQGIGLTNFLHHILLGAELLIRLRKEPANTSYVSIMSDATSAMIILAHQWMENVTIRSIPGRIIGQTTYALGPINHQKHIEGLIRFAELLAWPLLNEARRFIQDSYNKLIRDPLSLSAAFRDWLYGLVLPGSWFRTLIMACLLEASGLLSTLGGAGTVERGLVIRGKSYWPKRTVLGRVLGGVPNVQSVCGWIGPVPVPTGIADGWYSVNAKKVDYIMPVNNMQQETITQLLGFTDAEINTNPQGFINELSDINKWKPPQDLPARNAATAASEVKLEAIRLNKLDTLVSTATRSFEDYRANLHFLINNVRKTVVMNSNPLFVHAPQCTGATHPIHARLVKQYLDSSVRASTLKDDSFIIPATDKLLIIDARKPGEETLARAWCAENARHAIVRRNNTGCFTCATNLAKTTTGLAFNVLIWAS